MNDARLKEAYDKVERHIEDVSDYFAADWKYLSHYYRTGVKLDFRAQIEPGKGEMLSPLKISDFKPQKWISRWAF